MGGAPASDEQQRLDPAEASRTLGATVYTATTPGYDRHEPKLDDREPWVRLDCRKPPPEITSGEFGTLWNREQKLIHPPRTGLWSVYLDGSLSPKGPLSELVEGWLDRADVALFKHPHRACAYAEIDACVARGKITAREGERARSHLMLAGFPKDFGLWALGMIARRCHSNAIQIFAMPLVFHHVAQHVARDQIWFPYVLWKLREAPKRIHTIDADIFNNKFFSFRRHGS